MNLLTPPDPITVIKRFAVLLPLLALPFTPAAGQMGANALLYLTMPSR